MAGIHGISRNDEPELVATDAGGADTGSPRTAWVTRVASERAWRSSQSWTASSFLSRPEVVAIRTGAAARTTTAARASIQAPDFDWLQAWAQALKRGSLCGKPACATEDR